MITQIENALLDRLSRGLGRLANTVKLYGGELDDENLGIPRLPMVLVTFGGSRIECKNTKASRYQSQATFVVMVVVRSLRSVRAAHQGGVDSREIGANQLIAAVRRLLDGQRLGDLVRPLNPQRITTVLNNAKVRSELLTAYAIEYEAVFDDIEPLAEGQFPESTQDKDHPDYVFNLYQGELSASDPMLMGVDGKIYDPTSNAQVAFRVETKEYK